jgi:phage portal protein BeeE
MIHWWKRRAARPAEAKASRAGAVIALHAAGRPAWTARSYVALARAGYMKNPVVYRAVRMVTEDSRAPILPFKPTA